MVNYWLCVTNEENWKVVKKRKVWGVTEFHRRKIESAQSGDLLVFYVKPMRITGIFRVISDPYESSEAIFSSTGFADGEVFPYRLRLEPVTIPERSIEFTSLISRLAFIKRKDKKWASSIVGKAMIQIPKEDYDLIENELRKIKGQIG